MAALRKILNKLARWAQTFGLTRAICLVLLIALVALRIWDPAPVRELRLRTFDFFQQVRPREVTSHPVVILDIDEKSLRELGQWPWPRTLVADLIDKLTAAGALVVGFDVVFAEPDRMSPGAVAAAFRDIDDETRDKLRRLPSNDDVLAAAFRRSHVVLGRAAAAASAGAQPDSPAVKQAGFAVKGPDATPYFVTFPNQLRNVPVLEEGAAGRGLFSILPERDGIVRRVPLAMMAEGRLVPSLSLDMLRVVTGAGAVLVKTNQAGVLSVGLPGLDIPTDENGQIWVHFSRHDPNRYVSAVDLLHGQVPADRFAQRLVLIGTSATGLLDIKTTPVDPVMPGVEIHAQILESILSKSFITYPGYSIGAELIVAVVVGLGIIAATPILGAATVFVLGGVVGALLIATSWYWFLAASLMIDTTFPLLSTVLIFLTLVFVNYFREQKQRQQIRDAFGLYLSPVLVEELAKNPDKLVLGGEQRRMTILFSDVRGFTTISEHFKSDPHQLTSLMNRYLTPMTDAIIDHKGFIDKYIGDAIMAFWNAPLDDASQELNACEAAIEMLTRLEKLNEEFEREAKETGQRYLPFRTGIGINTGECVVGNMGSDFKFNYSVLGDSVNLASRLEGRSKDYGLPIILGSNTANGAKDKFATLEIDLITVKGKREPEAVFTVLGREDLLRSEEFLQLRDLNGRMLASFRKQDWAGALATIDACRKLADRFGLHDLYDIYVERIGDFNNNPPPPDWDGVFAYETK